MKYFSELSDLGKVRRLLKIKRMIELPSDYDYLYDYYIHHGRNVGMLYDMREILQMMDDLPDEIQEMIK